MNSVFQRNIEVPNLLKPPNREDQEHLTELMESVALKMTERFRNQSQAFRAFDASGKGKVFKSHFVESLERLRIRLSAADIAKIWTCLDPQKRGYITFNEFCLL
jgi:Ca2+-binding EF-hand superfamily protein